MQWSVDTVKNRTVFSIKLKSSTTVTTNLVVFPFPVKCLVEVLINVFLHNNKKLTEREIDGQESKRDQFPLTVNRAVHRVYQTFSCYQIR